MLIGELARRSGLGKHALRHYEALGLIYSSERSAGSRIYRDYDEQSLQRLQYIEEGKAMGMTLKEIKPLLDLYMSGALSPSEQLTLIEKQLTEIDTRLKKLSEIRLQLLRKREFLNPS